LDHPAVEEKKGKEAPGWVDDITTQKNRINLDVMKLCSLLRTQYEVQRQRGKIETIKGFG